MAEERLIDRDKDEKYRIITNEKGEEELIIKEDEPAEPEEIDYYYEEENELTEEQRLALEREAEEARLKKERDIIAFRESARRDVVEGKFATAMDAILALEDLDAADGEIYCLKLRAVTQNFTDFSDEPSISSAAAEVNSNATAMQRKEIYDEYGEALKALREQKGAEYAEVNEKFKAEQQARRDILKPRRRVALIRFGIAIGAFLVFLITALCFSSIMFSNKEGTFIYVTVAFAILAFICLVIGVIFAKGLINAVRMYNKNERDNTSKLGREKAFKESYYNAVNDAYLAINE